MRRKWSKMMSKLPCHGPEHPLVGNDARPKVRGGELHRELTLEEIDELAPEAPNRSQHGIPNTNRHPISIGKTKNIAHGACGAGGGAEKCARSARELAQNDGRGGAEKCARNGPE